MEQCKECGKLVSSNESCKCIKRNGDPNKIVRLCFTCFDNEVYECVA
ncbi:hypothetical protein [Candidatus Borrarchaeum sp.]|nr:hypothetical protein [Candidatus Borrarchaeum sp.]